MHLITQESFAINALIPIDSQLEESKIIYYSTKSKCNAIKALLEQVTWCTIVHAKVIICIKEISNHIIVMLATNKNVFTSNIVLKDDKEHKLRIKNKE